MYFVVKSKEVIKEQPPARNLTVAVRRLLQCWNFIQSMGAMN
jgi:hypothetical protein